MSYGTRGGGARRKPAAEEDPTVIPSTQPIGFLGRLPWKFGGTLRYKPSAANLQEHPGHHEADENAPLLGGGGDDTGDDYFEPRAAAARRRSGTTGSGHTSDSYRSRGDLFLSDGEEDAVPLDDEFTLPPERGDDRASNKTRSSKGKRVAGSRTISRTVSRTTVASAGSGPRRSLEGESLAPSSMMDLHFEEERVAREEEEDVERRREAAVQLAQRRGLDRKQEAPLMSEVEALVQEPEPVDGEGFEEAKEAGGGDREPPDDTREAPTDDAPSPADEGFVPARLPMFK
ncbi:MAG: hypothetical protein IMZ46_18630 [Acidobacteria bacterium]|nr:hypothetical protein [Acidobacteriota bacterium]